MKDVEKLFVNFLKMKLTYNNKLLDKDMGIYIRNSLIKLNGVINKRKING